MDEEKVKELERLEEQFKAKYHPGNIGQAMQASPELNARELLRQKRERLRREAYQIERLMDALPARLEPDADRALCDLIINGRI